MLAADRQQMGNTVALVHGAHLWFHTGRIPKQNGLKHSAVLRRTDPVEYFSTSCPEFHKKCLIWNVFPIYNLYLFPKHPAGSALGTVIPSKIKLSRIPGTLYCLHLPLYLSRRSRKQVWQSGISFFPAIRSTPSIISTSVINSTPAMFPTPIILHVNNHPAISFICLSHPGLDILQHKG